MIDFKMSSSSSTEKPRADPETLEPVDTLKSPRQRFERSNALSQQQIETEVDGVTTVTSMRRSDRGILLGTRSSRNSNEVLPKPEAVPSPAHRLACLCDVKGLKPGTIKYQAYLTYLTLGIIYGDIGTSPLYTVTAMFSGPPSGPEPVIGAVSLMLWTLMTVTLIKYIIFILMADDHGEGGTFAIFALLSRGLRERIKDDKTYRKVNYLFSVLAIISVAAIIADGILTPAISVTGAVAGISIAAPGIGSSATVGISCAILFFFFLLQRFGTKRVSLLFSPIVVVWLIMLAGIGIYNITRYPDILQAFNPAWAARFLGGEWQDTGGWASLGSAFLTVTGSEAMFADLGHFNAKAIRVSFICFVMPCLMLCYLGQAAAVAVDPSVQANAMFLSLPEGTLIPMLILSILAAIVASQAMVSATFSIVAQALRLQYMPRLTVKHTDVYQFGQVYVPEINYFLMVMVLIIIAGFRDVTALGYAYGITVSLAFLLTSFFYAFVIYFCFKRNAIFGIIFFLVFGFVDANFLAANLTKFTTGGWFSVVVCAVISSTLLIWRFGRFRMLQEQKKLARPVSELYLASEVLDNTGSLKETIEFADVGTRLLICFSSSTTETPAVFVHFLKRLPVRPKVLVFVTILAVNVAFVSTELKLDKIEHCDNVYRLIAYHGYAERAPSARRVSAFIIRELNIAPNLLNSFPEPTDEEVMRFVDPTFVLGHDRVASMPNKGFVHHLLVDLFQGLLHFSKPAAALLSVPAANSLEVGLQVEI